MIHPVTYRTAEFPSSPLEHHDKKDTAALPDSPACEGIQFSDDDCSVSSKHAGQKRSKSERSDSYSSVKEDFSGLPQSFVLSKHIKTSVEPLQLDEQEAVFDLPKVSASKPSRFNALPVEVLERILTNLMLDVPPQEYSPRNRDLRSCLLVSRAVNKVATKILYQHVTVPHSYVFSKFGCAIAKSPGLGYLVRRLDLSHFSSLGLGRTRQCNDKIQNLTSETLLAALERMPLLKEVLLQHHVDTDIDEGVLRKLFYGLPFLEALDLCASSNPKFVSAFTSALAFSPTTQINIRRLSLHECCSLRSEDLTNLLSRLPRLQILDLHHTRVTDAGLAAILPSAELTHLNLGRCTSLSGVRVVDFIAKHPAARSLVYLNLSCDVTRHRMLHVADVDALLPVLPPSLRSLHLSGAAVKPFHAPLLRRLTTHLEELSVAQAELGMADVVSLVAVEAEEHGRRVSPSQLRYLNVAGVASVTQSAIFAHSKALFGDYSSSTSQEFRPLEVLEVGERVAEGLGRAKGTNAKLGWTVKEFGKRSWYVKQSRPVTGTERLGTKEVRDEGVREWKMGARWWGMRKVPVAWSEVGGLYGFYMFKA